MQEGCPGGSGTEAGKGYQDADLASIADSKRLIEVASAAQARFFGFTQGHMDRVCDAMDEEGYRNPQTQRMAVDETGIGRYEDKIIKSGFATRTVCEPIRSIAYCGIRP